MPTPLQIDSDRLNRHVGELAKIGGRDDGGVCRLAFSHDDLDGRTYVAAKMKDLGLQVRLDALGNLFGILPSLHSNRAVMCGSHTDTVATGGRFDGALGVLAALECVERIVEAGIQPKTSIVVASFVNEEGVRFMPDMMGSMFHSGKLSLDAARGARDQNGVSIGEELDRLGFAGSDSLQDMDVSAFIELHIEQGPVLEDGSVEIGVVTHVQGLVWYEVVVHGASNHAGTTPMNRRHDAGETAHYLMHALRALPHDLDGLRLTIGSVTYHPNLVNVIPNQVRFTVDIRHPDADMLTMAEARAKHLFEEAQTCSVTFNRLAFAPPCAFAPSVVNAVRKAAEAGGFSHINMTSGAGHDAQILQSCYPSGMIFIPSKGGISHDVTEYSTPEHVAAGANVLLGALLELSNV